MANNQQDDRQNEQNGTSWNPVQADHAPAQPPADENGLQPVQPSAETNGVGQDASQQQPNAPQPQQPGPEGPMPGQNGQPYAPYWSQYVAQQQGNMSPEFMELRSIRTKITVANVAGPVSLIIGGVLLSTVALVFAILAWRNASQIAKGSSPSAPMANNLRKSALVSIVICAIALALNVVAVISIMPLMMEVLNSGDLSQLYGSLDGSVSSGSESSGGSSTWG